MNLQLVLGVLNAILSVIPQITSSQSVNQIVALLVQLEPTIVAYCNELGPSISNIVAALSANPATTAVQLAALKQLDTTVDAAFDNALTAYMQNHPSTPATPA